MNIGVRVWRARENPAKNYHFKLVPVNVEKPPLAVGNI
jgi:hypothetical protein